MNTLSRECSAHFSIVTYLTLLSIIEVSFESQFREYYAALERLCTFSNSAWPLIGGDL